MIETSMMPPAHGRVVWAGRWPRDVRGALDATDLGRTTLSSCLEETSELVVLDALSFPWESLAADVLDVPLVVALPGVLSADEMSAVLGGPLLSQLTPFDRLIESRSVVRDTLQQRWGLDYGMWIISPDTSCGDVLDLLSDQPDAAIRSRKRAWRQTRQLIVESLTAALRAQPFGVPRVALIGGEESLTRAAALESGFPVACLEAAATPPLWSDHVVIVLLPRIAADERVALLRHAHQRLRSAGTLIVIATVVAAPGEDRNLVPSAGELIEELNDATGLAVHVDELRSVRWRGEPLVRGVIISATSLSSGECA